ncbi:MAG TPA: ATP-binding protein [Burkholderiales bacterium]|nr:ATP-binding protein [Burkholderiales bacterium]
MNRVKTNRQPIAALAGRFDRLRIKLFLAIAGANAVLAIAAYLIFSWSFDRGVADYLQQADLEKLDAMTVQLAQEYELRGNRWDWIVNDEDRWDAMSRNALGLPLRAPKASLKKAAPPMEATREYPLTINRRLMLLDANRQLLIGRPDRAQQALYREIRNDTELIGYLGYLPRLEFVESIGRLYTKQQDARFAALAAGMLAAALLLGAGLAYWLSGRIRSLAQGTASLIQGDYEIALKAHGQDELAQLAQDFNTLAATLNANRQARSQWIADIAHELRTPLSILRGELEALQDGVRPLTQASLHSLVQEVHGLSRLVEDLHLLSMSDLGALNYHFEPLDLRESIHDAVEHHGRALQDKGFQVRTNIENALIQGDAMRLAQVFNNLLQNTLRYTDAPAQLQIDLRRDNGEAVVDWQDSSPGVAAEDLPRLTERLYRVDDSRNRASGGAGLGLAIAHAIVQAHRGTMTPQASALGGVHWQLRFPLYKNGHG